MIGFFAEFIKLSGFENVKDLKFGASVTYVISSDGQLFGWGDNQFGQLGATNDEQIVETPRNISHLVGGKVAQVSTG